MKNNIHIRVFKILHIY